MLVVSSGGEVRGGEGRVARRFCFFGFCGIIVGRGLGAREITIDVGAIRLATGQFLDAAKTRQQQNPKNTRYFNLRHDQEAFQ